MRELPRYLGAATAFVVCAGLGAAAQSVWPGSIAGTQAASRSAAGGAYDQEVDRYYANSLKDAERWRRATAEASAQVAVDVHAYPANWAQSAVIGSSGVVQPALQTMTIVVGSSSFTYTMPQNVPPNALYHQVVDRYYDASGQEVETRSASHVIGYDCHSGRRQQDLIVEDDGKGGTPRFVALLMGNEPTEGQKAVTAEDKVDVVAPASVPGSGTLAANR